jgi:hypothetical protein
MLPQEEVKVEGRRFAVSRQLGEGGFSFVYLVREIPDTRGEEFALKRVLLHEVGRCTLNSTDPPPPRLIGWNICRQMRRLNDVCVGQ